MVALFGISNKRFQPNSHMEKSEIRNQKSEKPTTNSQQPTANSNILTNQAFQQDLNNLIAPEHRDAYVDALQTKQRCSLDQNTCDKMIRDA
jgi:hypothetical protein